MKRAYTALCNTTDRDQDLMTALRWALDQAQQDQSVTLWCWDKENMPADVVAAAPSLGIRIHAEKPRPRGGRYLRAPGGPVVAVDVPLETLVEIEPFDHPVCLVHAYVPENDERRGWIGPPDFPYERPWIDAFQPECLAGPAIAATNPLIADPVVEVAMRSFTAKTFGGTTMYDSRDGDCVTHGLMELRRGGHVIEPDLLLAAALRGGWKGRQALLFWKAAREVAKGVKKRPKNHFRPDILSYWRSEAAVKERTS
jgi:hypothetical protein